MEESSRKRSSILKKPLQEEPMQSKRRISFSQKASIKEFTAGIDTATIWGTSYEESTETFNYRQKHESDEQLRINEENEIKFGKGLPDTFPPSNSGVKRVIIPQAEKENFDGDLNIISTSSSNSENTNYKLSHHEKEHNSASLSSITGDGKKFYIDITLTPNERDILKGRKSRRTRFSDSKLEGNSSSSSLEEETSWDLSLNEKRKLHELNKNARGNGGKFNINPMSFQESGFLEMDVFKTEKNKISNPAEILSHETIILDAKEMNNEIALHKDMKSEMVIEENKPTKSNESEFYTNHETVILIEDNEPERIHIPAQVMYEEMSFDENNISLSNFTYSRKDIESKVVAARENQTILKIKNKRGKIVRSEEMEIDITPEAIPQNERIMGVIFDRTHAEEMKNKRQTIYYDQCLKMETENQKGFPHLENTRPDSIREDNSKLNFKGTEDKRKTIIFSNNDIVEDELISQPLCSRKQRNTTNTVVTNSSKIPDHDLNYSDNLLKGMFKENSPHSKNIKNKTTSDVKDKTQTKYYQDSRMDIENREEFSIVECTHPDLTRKKDENTRFKKIENKRRTIIFSNNGIVEEELVNDPLCSQEQINTTNTVVTNFSECLDHDLVYSNSPFSEHFKNKTTSDVKNKTQTEYYQDSRMDIANREEFSIVECTHPDLTRKKDENTRFKKIENKRRTIIFSNNDIVEEELVNDPLCSQEQINTTNSVVTNFSENLDHDVVYSNSPFSKNFKNKTTSDVKNKTQTEYYQDSRMDIENREEFSIVDCTHPDLTRKKDENTRFKKIENKRRTIIFSNNDIVEEELVNDPLCSQEQINTTNTVVTNFSESLDHDLVYSNSPFSENFKNKTTSDVKNKTQTKYYQDSEMELTREKNENIRFKRTKDNRKTTFSNFSIKIPADEIIESARENQTILKSKNTRNITRSEDMEIEIVPEVILENERIIREHFNRTYAEEMINKRQTIYDDQDLKMEKENQKGFPLLDNIRPDLKSERNYNLNFGAAEYQQQSTTFIKNDKISVMNTFVTSSSTRPDDHQDNSYNLLMDLTEMHNLKNIIDEPTYTDLKSSPRPESSGVSQDFYEINKSKSSPTNGRKQLKTGESIIEPTNMNISFSSEDKPPEIILESSSSHKKDKENYSPQHVSKSEKKISSHPLDMNVTKTIHKDKSNELSGIEGISFSWNLQNSDVECLLRGNSEALIYDNQCKNIIKRDVSNTNRKPFHVDSEESKENVKEQQEHFFMIVGEENLKLNKSPSNSKKFVKEEQGILTDEGILSSIQLIYRNEFEKQKISLSKQLEQIKILRNTNESLTMKIRMKINALRSRRDVNTSTISSSVSSSSLECSNRQSTEALLNDIRKRIEKQNEGFSEAVEPMFPSPRSFVFLILNKFKTEKTAWIMDDINLPMGILELYHKGILSVYFKLKFSASPLDIRKAYDFESIELKDSRFSDLSASEIAMKIEILERCSRNVTIKCVSSDQFNSFLDWTTKVFEEAKNAVYKLKEILTKTDSFLIKGERNDECYIEKSVKIRKDRVPICCRIKYSAMNTLNYTDIISPRRSELTEEITAIPKGFHFISTFLSNPKKCLKS